MSASLEDVLATIDNRNDAALAELMELLSIPSVSTKPEHADDCRRAATWLHDQLKNAGLDVSIMETGTKEKQGHPVIVAKNKHQPGRPTVLVYGHYDVQPPEPLDLWHSPPFEPAVRDGKLFARGASDDKGQTYCHVDAVLAWQANGGLPVNLTLLIEGEEENASENLEAFVKSFDHDLKADVAVVSDTGQFARGVPAITYGLRGLCYQEIVLTAANSDLHSGVYGGAVPNAANELVKLLAAFHDADGRVNIPGFYDDVIALTDAEREQWKSLPFDEAAFYGDLGLSGGTGEAGFTPIERRWARPTLDVNGITSGYQGDGAKTVIPCRASAKVSMRLVGDQSWTDIRDKFRAAVRDRCPANCRVDFIDHGGIDASLLPMESKAMTLAAEAVEAGFGTRPVYVREGGSIPVGALFREALGIDTLFVGFGLPDDNLHAPNEKLDLAAFHAGRRTAAVLYEKLAAL
jgi:acetylornithine deacetylase/succinyl-diaminopimelate desuccinylase-like protein